MKSKLKECQMLEFHMTYNKTVNLLNITHTNPNEINMDKISIGSKGLVKYTHPKYGKSHVLVFRLPICVLDKYPIEYYPGLKNLDSKVSVNLKIPIDANFTQDPLYVFIQKILDKFGYNTNGKARYPNYDTNKERNYLKIKNMDLYQYSITEIINKDFKIKTASHKPSNITELTNIFKQNTQVMAYVMLYYHKMPSGDFVTLKPVKFYIGKNITTEQIDFANRTNRHVDVPKSDYFDCNQNARVVSIIDFIKFVQLNETNNSIEPVKSVDAAEPDINNICLDIPDL